MQTLFRIQMILENLAVKKKPRYEFKDIHELVVITLNWYCTCTAAHLKKQKRKKKKKASSSSRTKSPAHPSAMKDIKKAVHSSICYP